jgi:hypothetical protein
LIGRRKSLSIMRDVELDDGLIGCEPRSVRGAAGRIRRCQRALILPAARRG